MPNTIDEILDEQADIELTMVHFRGMPLRQQQALLLAFMDEYVGMAKEGKLERAFASQMKGRVDFACSYVMPTYPSQWREIRSTLHAPLRRN